MKTLVGAAMAWGLAGPASLSAQAPDSAPQAYGVYPAAPTPADTAAADTVAAETPARDTTAAETGPRIVTVPAPDTVAPPDTAPAADTAAAPTPAPPEEAADADTSLTARMDVRRGGGLSRTEFPDLRETARLTGRYSVFLELLGGELPETLGAAVTVLAPTDSAFAALAPRALERLRADSALRRRWIGLMVLEGDWRAAQLLGAGEVPTVGGDTLRFTRGADGRIRVAGATLVQPDLVARNGRLHGLDGVPPPRGAPSPPTSAAP